jgi:hypothetical protein
MYGSEDAEQQLSHDMAEEDVMEVENAGDCDTGKDICKPHASELYHDRPCDHSSLIYSDTLTETPTFHNTSPCITPCWLRRHS